MKKKNSQKPCLCGGIPQGSDYDACCRPYLERMATPPDAERLMRSRYTAYARGDTDYVLETWHASTRPDDLKLAPPGTPHAPKWLELTVHRHALSDECHATVQFTARYREGGRAFKMNELSRFVNENGRWFYVDGVIEP